MAFDKRAGHSERRSGWLNCKSEASQSLTDWKYSGVSGLESMSSIEGTRSILQCSLLPSVFESTAGTSLVGGASRSMSRRQLRCFPPTIHNHCICPSFSVLYAKASSEACHDRRI